MLRLRLGNLAMPHAAVIHLNQCSSVQNSQQAIDPHTHTQREKESERERVVHKATNATFSMWCGLWLSRVGIGVVSSPPSVLCLCRRRLRIRVQDFKLNKHKSNILQFLSLHAIAWPWKWKMEMGESRAKRGRGTI